MRSPNLVPLLVVACALEPRDSGVKPLAVIPIVHERLVRLPASVAGSAPFQVVLDTGMPTRGLALYRSERVDALGLRFQDEQILAGAGGSGAAVTARVAEPTRVRFGDFAIDDVTVIVLPKPRGFAAAGEGIVGGELFERFAVRVDVDALRLELFESKTFAPEPGSAGVPLRLEDGIAFLDARVAVGAGQPGPAELAIDLGASHALWLNGRSDGRLAAPESSIASRLGRGLSGEIEGRVGRVRKLELGSSALEDVVAVFPRKEHQRPGGHDFRDGFVGADALTRFHVTFDYAHERMWLAPGNRLAEPFEHDMTGLVLDPDDVGQVVRAVLPGTPAAEAGVLAGDRLVAVDGRNLDPVAPWLSRTFRVDGAELRLTLRRGDETIEKRVRLRRLV
ncbi:MAG TPA: aspartyl protease family protein [Planctomycetota bacterium]|nr:aspartyl protease family protein [Planctomycetota bacterium]